MTHERNLNAGMNPHLDSSVERRKAAERCLEHWKFVHLVDALQMKRPFVGRAAIGHFGGRLLLLLLLAGWMVLVVVHLLLQPVAMLGSQHLTHKTLLRVVECELTSVLSARVITGRRGVMCVCRVGPTAIKAAEREVPAAFSLHAPSL